MKTLIRFCLLAAGVFLLAMRGAGLQASAGSPAQAPPSSPIPAPHTNAPVLNASLGKIERMPGDRSGAYKTHTYRDLFAEQGHAPAESRARIEKADRKSV